MKKAIKKVSRKEHKDVRRVREDLITGSQGFGLSKHQEKGKDCRGRCPRNDGVNILVYLPVRSGGFVAK